MKIRDQMISPGLEIPFSVPPPSLKYIDGCLSLLAPLQPSMKCAGGAEPAAVLIAMDRMERGGRDDNLSAHSAVEDFQREYGVPVVAIATLTDLMQYLRSNDDPALAAHFSRVAAYRERYGV